MIVLSQRVIFILLSSRQHVFSSKILFSFLSYATYMYINLIQSEYTGIHIHISPKQSFALSHRK